MLHSGKLCLRPTSQSRIRSTAPLVGEPLAERKSFLWKTKLCGMPRPLPLGEVSAKQTERASPARKSRCEAIGRLFVRAILSQCKSCLAASLPSQALRASSPRGRALGKGKRHLYNQKSPRHDAERAGGFSYKAEGCGNSPPWGLVFSGSVRCGLRRPR